MLSFMKAGFLIYRYDPVMENSAWYMVSTQLFAEWISLPCTFIPQSNPNSAEYFLS